MTFEKQVKEAKSKRLENRIIRDVIFILLGITFFIISVVMAYKNSNKNNTNTNKTTTKVTTTIKEN